MWLRQRHKIRKNMIMYFWILMRLWEDGTIGVDGVCEFVGGKEVFAQRNSLEIHSASTILYTEVVKIFVLWSFLASLAQGEAAISNASCAAACTADSKCSAFAVDRDTVEMKCLVYNETAKGCKLQGAAIWVLILCSKSKRLKGWLCWMSCCVSHLNCLENRLTDRRWESQDCIGPFLGMKYWRTLFGVLKMTCSIYIYIYIYTSL